MIENPGGFKGFFESATGFKPYPYQLRLAESDALPSLINIPTGAGKTAAVVLAWLWRRRHHKDEGVRSSTPRRLVYCLPMRVLVEQTRDNAILWLRRLGLLGDEAALEGKREKERVNEYKPSWKDPEKIAITVLMGGEDADEWDFYPERDAIIIGTQDMLLSRALNRGYGMSRYRWPMHFGLLNNDCLWVMDEVQLMGVGVETSAQMQAFREMMGTQHNTHTIWMSATIGENQLKTADHAKPESGWPRYSLENSDFSIPILQKRYSAKKPINKSEIRLDKENSKDTYAKNAAQVVLSKHNPGTLTLCVVNTVKRAQEIFQELLKNGRSDTNTAVLHSHFREGDRAERMAILFQDGDRIVVSTQVVEAGVDVSAHTLITELAPWPSLVQRFGRCNRYGEFDDAIIEWFDIAVDDEKSELALPYNAETLESARKILTEPTLIDAVPKTLAGINYEPPAVIRPVIRKKDILDLFDTTPDLTGNDLDVSPYIRDGDDKDVQVYWRELRNEEPSVEIAKPRREELCSVSIGEINHYLKSNKGLIWDPLNKRWHSVGKGGEIKSCRPGQIILLDSAYGWYTKVLGWKEPEKKKADPVNVLPLQSGPALEQAMDDDSESHIGKWVLLNDHIDAVVKEVKNLASLLISSEQNQKALENAALWHDVGKAHAAFQNMLLSSSGTPPNGGPWGKSDKRSKKPTYWVSDGNESKIKRPYFRHELASALAWLKTEGNGHPNENLIAYLTAAHHGKIRLSIRSLPQENKPPNDDTLFARGIWQGDNIPPVPPIVMTSTALDLSLMQLGEGSWLERMVRIRDDAELGPFRLSFLETVLRVADWRASK